MPTGVNLDTEELERCLSCLGTFTALPGDPGLIPSTNIAVHHCLIIPIPGDPTLSFDLCEHHVFMWYTDTHTGQTLRQMH